MSVFLQSFGLSSSSSSHDADGNGVKFKSIKKLSYYSNKLSKSPISWNEFLNEDETKPLFDNGVDGHSDCSDDEIRTENIELSLRQRGRFPQYDKNDSSKHGNSSITTYKEKEDSFESKEKYFDFMELEISQGDTLQNLSIRYHCSVAELKRINKLISDQEFFGLRKVRIPVKKHGLLTEILPKFNEKYENKTHNFPDISNRAENELNEVRTVVIGIGPMGCGGSKEEAKVFLKKMDDDLARVKNATEHHDELCNEFSSTELLQIKPLVAEKKSCNDGIDCGIHWRNLLIVVLILGIVLPVVGALYMHFTSWNNSDQVASSNITTVKPIISVN